MENLFKKFNEEFFNGVHVMELDFLEFFDKDCLYDFDENFVVRLTIDDVDVRDNYDGYFVEIIHKKKGSVCKKFFRFSDYLEMNHRKDSQHFCHVWLNEGTFEWYISTPKDVNQMVIEIERWLDIFLIPEL
jgi:hypothetical protein